MTGSCSVTQPCVLLSRELFPHSFWTFTEARLRDLTIGGSVPLPEGKADPKTGFPFCFLVSFCQEGSNREHREGKEVKPLAASFATCLPE